MKTNIFEKLIRNKISKFVFDYREMSRQVFVNDDGKQIHSGEFGSYREKIVMELIKPFLPSRLDVGTGFVIAADNKVSTQCDVIIYDKANTPILENNDQRFFPVECVVGVIEVKSKLTKTQFKDALIKLSHVKDMKNHTASEVYVFKDGVPGKKYETKKFVRNQMATMLLCESIDMDFSKGLNSFFKDVYKGIDKSLFHNMVLSLDNGLFLYYINEDSMTMYHSYFDYSKDSFDNYLVYPLEQGYEYEHIVLFLDYFYMLVSSISVLFIEITNYLGNFRIKGGTK